MAVQMRGLPLVWRSSVARRARLSGAKQDQWVRRTNGSIARECGCTDGVVTMRISQCTECARLQSGNSGLWVVYGVLVVCTGGVDVKMRRQGGRGGGAARGWAPRGGMGGC